MKLQKIFEYKYPYLSVNIYICEYQISTLKVYKECLHINPAYLTYSPRVIWQYRIISGLISGPRGILKNFSRILARLLKKVKSMASHTSIVLGLSLSIIHRMVNCTLLTANNESFLLPSYAYTFAPLFILI